MSKRRFFLKQSFLLGAGAALYPYSTKATALFLEDSFVSRRPAYQDRKFSSQAVENKIIEIKSKLKDKELAWIFENCFPNTLDTTVTIVSEGQKPDTYVITGDIDAMWLRDSSAQVWPYLPLIKKDVKLESVIEGVINRQANYVLLDPYANAFYLDNKQSWHKDDTEMRPGVHERKWEIDSLCYVIRLAHGFWKNGGKTNCFDQHWLEAMKTIVHTFKQQQRKENNGPYRFRRTTNYPTDTAAGSGYGNLAKPNGLICSVFRPSDDATIFPYLIPSNLFAVVSLKQLAEILQVIYHDEKFASECLALASEVHQSVKEHGIVEHVKFGKIFAYEVDGFGGQYLADDANVPSLLSLPYLNALEKEDKLIYQNTRRFLLSYGDNPYYVKGKAAEGISGPHAGKDNIWPMGIILRALTSMSDDDILQGLKFLKTTHAGTGFMHESFNKDDATKFTRKWFAWANTLFGELIIKVMDEKPHLIS